MTGTLLVENTAVGHLSSPSTDLIEKLFCTFMTSTQENSKLMVLRVEVFFLFVEGT